jgi:hypothetical protein
MAQVSSEELIGIKLNTKIINGIEHYFLFLVNGNANQTLRQKQPPMVTTSVIPPPQIATLAQSSQTNGGQGGSNTLNRPQPYRPQPQLGLLPLALTARYSNNFKDFLNVFFFF